MALLSAYPFVALGSVNGEAPEDVLEIVNKNVSLFLPKEGYRNIGTAHDVKHYNKNVMTRPSEDSATLDTSQNATLFLNELKLKKQANS